MNRPNAAMNAPASRLISASASNMAVIGGAPSSAPHASGKYMVLIHQTGGSGSSPSTPKALARRGHRVCRVNRVGSARKASYSSALRYSPSTHWNWTSSGRSPPGQRICLEPSASSDLDGRNGHAGRPVPAEADRGVPQAVEVQLGVVAGVLVRDARHARVEVLQRQRHQRDAVRLAQGDRVFEPLQALCGELGAFEACRHVSSPRPAAPAVQSAAILSAAAASRPQPSAPA